MNRIDLVRKLAFALDITQLKADEIVLAFAEAIKTGVRDDGRVCVQGFCSFTARDVPPRQVSAPGLRGYVLTQAKKKIHFRMSQTLHKAVNDG